MITETQYLQVVIGMCIALPIVTLLLCAIWRILELNSKDEDI
jgi:hypothetical protein